MKIIIFLIYIVFFLLSCKENKVFWNPNYNYPSLNLQENKLGVFFNMNSISPSIHTIVINIFAPNCPPCEDEIVELNSFYENIVQKQKNVLLIGLGASLETLTNSKYQKFENQINEIVPFVQKYNITYPIYLANQDILKSFGITGFPETFILKRNQDGYFYLSKKIISSVTLKVLKAKIL